MSPSASRPSTRKMANRPHFAHIGGEGVRVYGSERSPPQPPADHFALCRDLPWRLFSPQPPPESARAGPQALRLLIAASVGAPTYAH